MSQQPHSITFNLNGTAVSVAANPLERLTTTLRDRLGAIGTKVGCEAGDCGACTVLMDGDAVCGCLVLAGQAAGKSIETVEGLAASGQLAGLQQAFLRTGAVQCGICTPGMLMAATALLRQRKTPSEADIRTALAGVLCRCTGYQKIIEAVHAAAAGSGSHCSSNGTSVVGQRLARIDGVLKVKGEDRFGADEAPDDALWLRFVRSPHARARFRFCDLESFQRARPGLVKILTAKDVPGVNRIGCFPQYRDQPVFAEGAVKYRGEAVAALVGQRETVEGIDLSVFPIEWDLEPPVTMQNARMNGGVPVHGDRPDNILVSGRLCRGKPGEEFGAAEIVVEGEFETSFVEHAYIEPEAGYARRLPNGRIEIAASTQSPYLDRSEVARVLGLPDTLVRIRPSACGGGFGGKLDLSVEPALAIAAWLLERPVRCIYGRVESMAASTKRHPGYLQSRLAVDGRGKFLAYDLTSQFNTGAYASWGPTIASRVPNHGAGPYRFKAASLTADIVYTNDTPAGAFRGFGVPQAMIALESLIDDAAYKLGMDRLAIRQLNALRAGDKTITGQVLKESVGQIACFDAIAPAWHEEIASAETYNAASKGPLRRGVGIAGVLYGCGNTASSNPSSMQVELRANGELILFNGAVDIGQGSSTVILQICADAIGLKPGCIGMVTADTDLTLDAGKSSASRQTFVSGRAAYLAGVDFRSRVLALANMGEDAKLQLDGTRMIVSDSARTQVLDLTRLPRETPDGAVILGRATFDPPTTKLDSDGQGVPYATYIFGAQLVSLTVDTDLGTTTVNRVVVANDLGRTINPTLAEGQIEGAVVQGLGMALMEEFIPGGTENLHDYLIPTIGDVPPIEIHLIEDPEPLGPFGAKGLGEGAIIPTPAAVLNAIRHATGARITKLPALPHRVLAALRATDR